MGNLPRQGDLELLRVRCVCRDSRCHRQERHTVACRRSVFANCDSARVRSDAGISLALYIVVRCNAHSIKLLRREVRICAMFQNVERRLVEV
jgi:hypothetical protein